MLRNVTTVVSVLALFSAVALADRTDNKVHFVPDADQEQRLQIDGTSNLHDWSSKTHTLEGHLNIPAVTKQSDQTSELRPDLTLAAGQPELLVRIPVRTLKSSRDGLDDRLYRAMKASRHSHVEYVLESADSQPAPDQDAGTVVWQTTGKMTVAGTTRTVELDLLIVPMEDGLLRIEVQKTLNMSDFDIEPPRALLGLARAADPVDVQAVWIVRPQTSRQTQAAQQ